MSDKLMLNNETGIRAVLQAMGYSDGTERCGNCAHFHRPTEDRGPDTCCRNAFLVPVSESGICNFHHQRAERET